LKRLPPGFPRLVFALALLSPLPLAAQAAREPSASAGVSGVKDFLRVAPVDVKWVQEADGSGVERATIFGDPTKPGIYVVQVKFPRGIMSRPHYHAEDRHATVIKGTWYTGTGERFVPTETVAVPTGGYMMHPAGEIHYDGALEEEVIVRIVGFGPSRTVRLSDTAFGPSLPR
jgi:quercetin dioxygenase-like cupin family protein